MKYFSGKAGVTGVEKKEGLVFWTGHQKSHHLWLTISKKLQDSKVHLALPPRIFLDGNAITSGGKDLSTANGHQLAAFISARHVVQHCCIIDEGIQFPVQKRSKQTVQWRNFSTKLPMEPLKWSGRALANDGENWFKVRLKLELSQNLKPKSQAVLYVISGWKEEFFPSHWEWWECKSGLKPTHKLCLKGEGVKRNQ